MMKETSQILIKDQFFIPFKPGVALSKLPTHFTFKNNDAPHVLCLQAASQLKHYLITQDEWLHNFGLGNNAGGGVIIGKMFGVLVVQTQYNEIGFLAAFSGKLAGSNQHPKFVPPIFDGLTEKSFVNNGMTQLARINEEIRQLEITKPEAYETKIHLLKNVRRNHSAALQMKIFDHYHFLNQAGHKKSLTEIFKEATYKNPPSGAGECAAPKLLQYAFQQNMKPLALAEFWWGQSPKSTFWKHGHFYPTCREKCEPILAHMLSGMDCESKQTATK